MHDIVYVGDRHLRVSRTTTSCSPGRFTGGLLYSLTKYLTFNDKTHEIRQTQNPLDYGFGRKTMEETLVTLIGFKLQTKQR